jgi:hypothetical protein
MQYALAYVLGTRSKTIHYEIYIKQSMINVIFLRDSTLDHNLDNQEPQS